MKTAVNDITGDPIRSKPSSAYESNYDTIFRKPKEEPKQLELDFDGDEVTPDKPLGDA